MCGYLSSSHDTFYTMKEEEEEVTYTEDEEAIIAYLKEDDPLPNELLEKIISEWWKKEPFR